MCLLRPMIRNDQELVTQAFMRGAGYFDRTFVPLKSSAVRIEGSDLPSKIVKCSGCSISLVTKNSLFNGSTLEMLHDPQDFIDIAYHLFATEQLHGSMTIDVRNGVFLGGLQFTFRSLHTKGKGVKN